MTYTQHYNKRVTPQSQAIPGSTQIPNNAGGYAWKTDDWKQLDRFLILGSLGGTYYVSEKALTIQNAAIIEDLIKADGKRVVDRVVEISDSGRAPKNDPALFVLAMCAGSEDSDTRAYALANLDKVARIGTHLFTFLEYAQAFRGWGRGLRKAVANWYTRSDIDYQVIKYRQRNNWTHRDVLRVAHPTPANEDQQKLFAWITQGTQAEAMSLIVEGYLKAQTETNPKKIAELVRTYNLPREALPTEVLTSPEVWEALLEKMPLTAMIRNLGVMGSVGLLSPGKFNASVTHVVDELHNTQRLIKSRVHPIALLSALITYEQGHGTRGNKTWKPVAQIVDSLDDAFYMSFGNVEPTNKRMMLALDVSGSMSGGEVSGVPGLTPRVASAAMALVTAYVERYHTFTAFTTSLVPLSISPKQRLDDVVRSISGLPFGGTDCAQPMIYALNNGLEIDTFVVYTDSETWFGNIHPAQALKKYRELTGIPAKLVVVGMVTNGRTIADPNDPGMLDVSGFDTATPEAISQFALL